MNTPSASLICAGSNSFVSNLSSNQVLRQLSSLRLAIGELLIIGVLSAIGTVIEQEKPLEFYQTVFPDDHKLLGFLSWKLIISCGLNRIYSNPIYYTIIFALGLSLFACTSKRQWPMVRISQKWDYPYRRENVLTQNKHHSLPRARVKDLSLLLKNEGYQIFQLNGAMYGFKGITGRFAPILVHAALILTMIGTMGSAAGSWKGRIMVPEQGDFLLMDHITPATSFAIPPIGAKTVVHVDDLTINYLEDGSVDQFYSNLTMLDMYGNDLLKDKISVNKPMRFNGITIYQTDWGMVSLTLTLKGSSFIAPDRPTSLLLAPMKGQPFSSSRTWGTFVPIEKTVNTKPRGISLVLRDFKSVTLYDSNGQFSGVRSIGSKKPISLEGIELVVMDAVGSTGLELKSDPAVPIIYTGFGFLLISSFLSTIPFSQVLALQEGSTLHVGCRNNRGSIDFTSDLESIVIMTPEYTTTAEIKNY